MKNTDFTSQNTSHSSLVFFQIGFLRDYIDAFYGKVTKKSGAYLEHGYVLLFYIYHNNNTKKHFLGNSNHNLTGNSWTNQLTKDYFN